MPSLEQIIRPFVVDPTTPPVPYVTTLNEPAPDPVRLNIGIGRTRLSGLSTHVAPIVPPPPEPTALKNPTITTKTLSSSHSISIQYYHDQKVEEDPDPFGFGGNPFGLGAGITFP